MIPKTKNTLAVTQDADQEPFVAVDEFADMIWLTIIQAILWHETGELIEDVEQLRALSIPRL
jgi:hypothetical protein